MAVYIRALRFYRPDRGWILLLLALIGVSVVVGLLQAWPMAVLIDAVLTPSPHPHWIHRLFLAPLPPNRLAQVIGITLIGMALKVLQDTTWLFRVMVNNRLRYNGLARVRTTLYGQFQALSFSYHRAQPQGDAIYRLSSDAQGFFGILDTFIATAVAAVTLVVMTAIMLSRSVSLTAFALAVTPLLVLANVYFGRVIYRRALDAKRADSECTTVIQRGLAAMPLIQAFWRQKRELTRLRRAVEEANAAGMRLNWQEALYPLTRDIVFALGGAIIFGYGGYLVYRDQFLHPVPHGVTCGDLMVFMAYLGSLWDPLNRLASFWTNLQTHTASARRVFHVLDYPREIVDPPAATPLPVAPRTLSLHHVGFAYPGQAPVLQDITAQILPGQMVAFVGPSGTGKSTLLSLLARFYDPQHGQVRLDHHDLRTLRVEDVRRHVSLVGQDVLLLAGTIAENIAYGRPAASPAAIQGAAAAAGAASFIDALPHGYVTPVAESGQNLSGGQRQRIALARGLLTAAPILVLDEPTSALDPPHQRQVLSSLRALTPQRTVIVVTHDLASAAQCDWIFVLHQGRLVEQGTHEQLLLSRGAYHRLHAAASPTPADVSNVHQAA